MVRTSLSDVEDPDERLSLMKIPTSLYLSDEQIDRLVRVASKPHSPRCGISAAHVGYTGKITRNIGTDGSQHTPRDGPSSALLPGMLVLNQKRDVRRANGSHELQTKTTNDSA